MEEGQATAELKPLFTSQEEETTETGETREVPKSIYKIHSPRVFHGLPFILKRTSSFAQYEFYLPMDETVTVTALNGETCDINTRNFLTVGTLKKEAATRLHITKKECMLVFNDQELSDNLQISTTKLKHGSTIRILPKSGKGLSHTVTSIFFNAYDKIMKIVDWFPQYFQDTTRKLTEKDLARIAQAIGQNWELLGYELGIKKVQLDQISADFNTVVNRTTRMLLQWLNQNPLEATVGKLYVAIERCREVLSFDRTLVERALVGI